MNPVAAWWKRYRRGLYRAVAMIGAFAVVAGGLVAVTAPAARADQTVTSGGPYTITNPGGDMVASVDVPGVDPAIMNTVISTTWPESVGLSASPSLSALFQATWSQSSSVVADYPGAGAAEDPEPPSFDGGTATAASDGSGGSTVTFDIPAADVSANSNLPEWAQGVLSTLAGAASYLLTFGLCELAVLGLAAGTALATAGASAALTPAGTSLCVALANAVWSLVGSVVSTALAGTGFNAAVWKAIFAKALAYALIGYAFTYWQPIIGTLIKTTVNKINSALLTFVAFIAKWVGKGWSALSAAIKRFFTRAQQEVEIELPNIENQIGLTPPASTGETYYSFPFAPPGTRPGTPVSASCMDAYDSGGTPSPGSIVAVNTCDGGASQSWDYYSDGAISIGGLCLDTQGGTGPLGTPLVNLEPCDGSSSQDWKQSGTALVNSATSDCLDDPNDDTTPGTQFDIFTCNGSAAQQWQTPAPETCDIYAANGTACVAAYSMDRALYASYDGPLYQVTRASDGTTDDIGLLNTGGDVDAATQDSFCFDTVCTITEIYDQSPLGNNLTIEGAGGNGPADSGAIASALPIKINGDTEAYGLDVEPGVGYRDDATAGVATDGEPEGMYMVASGTHVNSGCCFDFGNAEADNDDNLAGHMDAVNLSTTCFNGGTCSGSGPWVQADMENGLFMGSTYTNTANKGNSTSFVTAMLGNNGQNSFSLNGGDSTSGGLSTWYNGSLPSGYAPMSQEGAIVLGTGGDNSQSDIGSWFEGVMTAGDPSQAADNAVQASIVAAGYSGSTNPVSTVGTGGVTPSAAGAAVVHDGYSSVYTVDSANGHLQETYLPAMGDSWSTQDLSATGGTLPGTPPVMPGTQPVALFHCGYTSVYTVDAGGDGVGTGDLQETYLPAAGFPGDAWSTQDLSQEYKTPPTDVTPTAVVHDAGATGAAAACGFTSVYTVDRGSQDLEETYLPYIGDGWTAQDLTTNYEAPKVAPGTSPVAVVHSDYTSVYSVGENFHLEETYLPAIGDEWDTQDLSAKYLTPDTQVTPTAVVHDGYTSVYTVDQSNSHLQETYLPAMGDAWSTQDLSQELEDAGYTAPEVAPGTAPVALFHTGYTSVYTVDEGTDHLQETYLPAAGFPGDPWATQDLTANYQAPTTAQTPIVLLHPDTSGNLTWTSVYTIDEFNDHLQETYLPAIGDGWTTQDLMAKYEAPEVAASDTPTASSAVVHSGYTSVYTGDSGSGDLQETYLTAMGQPWATQNLSTEYEDTPPMMSGTVPVAVTHDGYTSVYTIDAGGNGVTAGDLQETYLPALGDSWSTQDLSKEAGTPASETTPAAVFHDGYTSVYSVNASNGDLWETFLPALGGLWYSQNLTTMTSGPVVDAYTSPAAVFHDGYTSVYTVDAATEDLQETYLPALGGPWTTQNLSANYHTPTVNILSSPTAVVHNGFVSVYTIDAETSGVTAGDLQETYLPAIGDPWTTQDLTTMTGGPQVAGGTQPAALYHDGYTSVYTYDAGSLDLQETFLPAIGDPWTTQNLSSLFKTPAADGGEPVALLHYDTNGGLTWTSVYTVDSGSDDLQETYLPDAGFPGDSWVTQNLSSLYKTPAV